MMLSGCIPAAAAPLLLLLLLLLPLAAESSIDEWTSKRENNHHRYGYSNSRDIEYHYPASNRGNDISSSLTDNKSKEWNGDSMDASRRYRVLSQKTSGVLRTYQRGTAMVPRRGGAVADVLPEPRKTFRTTVTSTVLEPAGRRGPPPPPIPPPPPSPMTRHLPREHWAGGLLNDAPPLRDEMNLRGICNRCPLNQTLIAKKGRQYILMKDPMPKHCRRRGEIRMQTIRGPNPGDALGEGSHYTLVAQHRGAKVHLCMYQIDVAVRRCPELTLHPHVMAECSADSAWGSQCRFTCHEGYELDGPSTVECSGRLRWRRPAPRCLPRDKPPPKDGSCPLPSTPDGTFDCNTPDVTNTNIAIGLLPEHTICRIECNVGFTLTQSNQHLSVIGCRKGFWNGTHTQQTLKCIPASENNSGDEKTETFSEMEQETNHIKRHHHGYPPSKEQLLQNDPPEEVCEPNPCQGGGTCLQGPEFGPALCICPNDRQGDRCDRVICPDEYCLNGGHCIALGSRHVCYCRPGYSGNRCEDKRNYGAHS